MHQLVELDQGPLYVAVEGQGTPTVVLEAGLGDGLESWELLARLLSGSTTVLRYDRPGLGNSPPADVDRRPMASAARLHQLMERLGLTPPHVLVGHSLGALTARAFAHEYPGELVGLVLLDPTDERMVPDAALARAAVRALAGFQQWRAARTTGPQRALAAAVAAEHAVALAAGDQARQFDGIGMAGSGLTVVSAALGRGAERAAALHRGYADLHGGRHVIAPASGHYVHHDEPELVASLVLALLKREPVPRSP